MRRSCWIVVGLACILGLALSGSAAAKSLYVIADHHTAQFDAWNQNPDGTVTYQTTHNCSLATDPAGIAIWEDASSPAAVIFITSEFNLAGVELVDATTMTSLGSAPATSSNLAGIDVDDVNLLLYTIRRDTNTLYVYHWDPVGKTLTPTFFSPQSLPGVSGGFGLALDETRGILWIADTRGGMVRAFDTTTFVEDPSLSFTPMHNPVDIVVDRRRDLVYTVSMYGGAALPYGTGSTYISQWDVVTKTETTVDMGHHGVGLAIDEITGYIYVTGGAYTGDNLSVWDMNATPMAEMQDVGRIGNPAGLVMANASYNPLNLTKSNGLAEDGCAMPAGTLTYEMCFDNMDNPFDVYNVTLVDDLPLDVVFTSATGGGLYNAGTHSVTWDFGTVPAGQTPACVNMTVECSEDLEPLDLFVNNATIGSDETGVTTVNNETEVCEMMPVAIDIKPGSCPNPINGKSKGVVPVAVLGDADVDITMIDPASVFLEGVAPLRWSWGDVATPHDPWSNYTDRYDCNELGPDGYMDLKLKFDKQDLLAAIGEMASGDVMVLTLSGAMYAEFGGMPILGVDVVWFNHGFTPVTDPAPISRTDLVRPILTRVVEETELREISWD